MSLRKRLQFHVIRLRHQIGTPLKLGDHPYRLRGYFANGIQHHALRHEPYLTKSLCRALDASDGPFIDVGVNIGQTLLKILAHDPGRQYIGFEPQIDCAFFIDSFLTDNSLTNFQVLPIALAEKDQLMTLYLQQKMDEGASTQREKIHHGVQRAVNIQARRGDDVLAELGVPKPAIIKIDVEGAELQVLTGLRDTLETAQPVLFFEINPNFIKMGGKISFLPDEVQAANRASAANIWSLLTSLGYRLNQISNDGEEVPCLGIDIDDVDGFISADYIAYPEKHG